MIPDPHNKWKENHGDETYALDWKIDSAARVWEIGGFEGRWAAQIVEKFDPYMEIFEPQGWAFEKLKARFRDFENVDVYNYGLWVMDASLPLYYIGTDGASLLHPGAHSEVLQFRDIYNKVYAEVDLCLMNIEGAEFVLLPYMIGNDLMQHFRYFWCQFHPGLVNEGETRFLRIFEGLKRTHRVKWNFYPTAVAWERL